MTKRFVALFFVVTLFLHACSGDNDNPAPSPTPIPTPSPEPIDNWRVIDSSITSAITGITYPLHIFLPANYQQPEHADTLYPVIYATDGQWVFPAFADILDSRNLSVILVAIEQGPNDRRATDYTLPGAYDYIDFLSSELLPHIESEYRADPEQRTLSGTSYGGLLTGRMLLLDDISAPLFKNIFSFDGSFWRNWSTTRELEQLRYNASDQLNVTLVLTSATGYQSNNYDVNRFQNLLEDRNYSGFTLFRFDYAVEHEAVGDPSFEDAVDSIFIGNE